MRFLVLLTALLIGISSYAVENLGVYGKTYKIAEEDILKWIKENAKLPKISKKEIEEKIKKAASVSIDIPVAKRDRVRQEKVIYEVPQDIVINGKLIAKKGTKINVLERIKLHRKYIILADYMLPKFADKSDVNTVFLLTSGNVKDAEEKYRDILIYGATKQILKSLKVEKVPSIVYQKGDSLVIEERAWKDGKN